MFFIAIGTCYRQASVCGSGILKINYDENRFEYCIEYFSNIFPWKKSDLRYKPAWYTTSRPPFLGEGYDQQWTVIGLWRWLIIKSLYHTILYRTILDRSIRRRGVSAIFTNII